jgi:VanZ like family/Concanavalin A-like lectin/glucanases superfamily
MVHRRSVIKLALVGTVLGLVYLGLEPLAFSPANRVSPDPSGVGLAFEPPAMALSESSLIWEGPPTTAEISIHVWLEPDIRSRKRFGAVLSLVDDDEMPSFLVAQWRDGVNLRVRAANRRGYWEIGAPGVLEAGRRHLVTITSGAVMGTHIFVDGELRAESSRSVDLASGETLGGRLIVGSQTDGAASWTGTIVGLAIQDEALESAAVAKLHRAIQTTDFSTPMMRAHALQALYLFGPLEDGRVRNAHAPSQAGALRVPSVFVPPRSRIFIVPSWRDVKRPWFLTDLMLNVVGFIPLGFLGGHLRYRHGEKGLSLAAFWIVALGIGLSAGIETIQIWLPGRSSSLVDLIGNSLGTSMGLGLALWVERVTLRPSQGT